MNIFQKYRYLRPRLLACVTFAMLGGTALVGCGGGGGGGDGDFVGAANTQLTVTPTTIDTGDRILVKVHLDEIHKDGIALKLRFPTTFTYVSDSAVLTVDNNESDASPTNNAVVDTDNYLVFYIAADDLGQNRSGELWLQLEAKEDGAESIIEVDADVDDVNIPNGSEFDASNPEFAAEDEAVVTITG